MHFEASLLLAKISFYRCQYQAALTIYSDVNLDSVTISTSSPRLLHIVAEAFALKGDHWYFGIKNFYKYSAMETDN